MIRNARDDLTMLHYVSKARFRELVERAISELPPQFRQFLEEVPVQVETRPSRKLMQLGDG